MDSLRLQSSKCLNHTNLGVPTCSGVTGKYSGGKSHFSQFSRRDFRFFPVEISTLHCSIFPNFPLYFPFFTLFSLHHFFPIYHQKFPGGKSLGAPLPPACYTTAHLEIRFRYVLPLWAPFMSSWLLLKTPISEFFPTLKTLNLPEISFFWKICT